MKHLKQNICFENCKINVSIAKEGDFNLTAVKLLKKGGTFIRPWTL